MTDDVRGFAVQFYNQTWDLIGQTGRIPDDDRQMLTFAMASRALSTGVGGDEQITGDWQVAHVPSLTGYPDLALEFATAAELATVDRK